MQTRKRAKSVMFGKKSKDEKEEGKKAEKTIEEKKEAAEAVKPSEKAETVERRTVPEKPQGVELSSTLTDTKSESTIPEITTPSNEFLSDQPATQTNETPESSATTPEIKAEPVASLEPEISAPLATPAAEVKASEITQASSSETAPTEASKELSSTLPQSAFSIQTSDTSSYEEEKGKKKFGGYFFVVALLAFILGLGAMAAMSYFKGGSMHIPSLPQGMNIIGAKPTATPVPTAQPTATPTPQSVNLQSYTVSVLNGSGVAGKAASVKSSLTTAGFKVGTVGNADNNNYTKTEIAAKSSVSQAYLTKLETELQKNFTVDSTVASLPSSSASDVSVTLGSSTAQ